MARLVSTRGTCIRRKVGCVLVDSSFHVLSTGYNGPPSGVPHCNELGSNSKRDTYPNACEGANSPSGTSLDKCAAVHAEQNALLQCPNIRHISTAYCTTSSCVHCIKLLMNTSCQRLVFSEEYSHGGEPMKLWLSTGRQWIHLPRYTSNPNYA